MYSWGLFNQNIAINQIVQPGYVLCWGAKWLGEKKVYSDALINYPSHFKANPTSDKKIAESIHAMMEKADIIITHNGNNFDLKWLNYIFVKNGLKPVSTYKSIDTLREVKNAFRFVSNKLDYLCQDLDIGKKIDTSGFGLWPACMKGDRKAWKKMVSYCEHDVLILEALYTEIRPFMKNHPNLALYGDPDVPRCSCGSTKLKKNGKAYTSINIFQRYTCLSCGKDFRGPKSLLTKEQRANIPRNLL